jgi:uncharacterized damage-inducible protein DinB
MLLDGTINKLDTTQNFFLKTIEGLEEKDGMFKPQDGMFSVAQHIAHTAQTVDWFIEGMYSKEFNTDFDALEKEVFAITSYEVALKWFNDAFERGRSKLRDEGEEALKVRLAPGPIMGGVPRYIVIGAISDHTAHHRGALAVYMRLLGKEPNMPYE